MAPQITLLRIPLTNVTMDEALELLLDRTRRDSPTQVSFVNADCVNIAYRDADYLRVLTQSDLNFIDGVGMKIAGRWLGQPIVDNVNGTDLLPLLCARIAGTPTRLALLGAKPGVAAEVVQWIERTYRDVQVVACHDGYFSRADEPRVIQEVAAAQPDILLVAFGAPRQEKWIHEHLAQLNAKVVLGVGGLFDFYSGRIPRAPLWMRRCGLEWCWRMYQEPLRLCRRYLLGNPLFLWRVLRERLRTVPKPLANDRNMQPQRQPEPSKCER